MVSRMKTNYINLLRILIVLLVVVIIYISHGVVKKKNSLENVPPNIVLVVADALRADHLGLYGYSVNTGPFINELGKSGAVVKNVKSQASWTFPSMFSIFSGLTAIQCFKKDYYVVDDIQLITEILQKHGYHTYGISANPHLRGHTAFVQGFDLFKYIESNDGSKINQYLRNNVHAKLEEPYFLWLHYMDTHSPYSPPDKYIRTIKPEITINSMVLDNCEVSILNELEIYKAEALYDAAILYWDNLVRDVYEMLNSESNVLWVITSDHGEEFHDHGGTGHGNSLYEELLHIPLIFSNRNLFPSSLVLEQQVSSIDILPTLLNFAGIDKMDGLDLEGRNIFSSSEKKSDFIAYAAAWKWEPRLSRTLRVVYKNNWKYIHDYTRNNHELYNLSTDPGEKNNLASKQPQIRESLCKALEAYYEENINKYKFFRSDELEQRIKDRLKSLGYVE